MSKTQQEIDLNEPFANCLRSNPEFVAACQRRDELEQQLKKMNMAFSFGEFDAICDLDEKKQRAQAIEDARQGKPIKDNVLLMKPREFAKRKINLIQLAYDKQVDIVRKMQMELWREAAGQYKETGRILFEKVLDAGENFLQRLIELGTFHDKLRSEVELSELLLPWKIELGAFNNFSVRNMHGHGGLREFCESSQRRLEMSERA